MAQKTLQGKLALVTGSTSGIGLGMARALERGLPDRFERLGEAFHPRVHAAFRGIAAAEPDRCLLLDATQAPEDVFRAAAAAVAGRLGMAL